MITGTIKNKIDKIWKDIWASGLTQPITVIEQIRETERKPMILPVMMEV